MSENLKKIEKSWNVMAMEWNSYARSMIEKTFTTEIVKIAEELLRSYADTKYDNDIYFARKVSEHEEALLLYFSYKNQFNINRYGKDIYQFLDDKSDFNNVLQGINYLLAGQKPYFNKDANVDSRPSDLIKKDMKHLLQADKVLIELGFNELSLYSDVKKDNAKIIETRGILRDVYSDLEHILQLQRSRKYKTEQLSTLTTKVINPILASKYFKYEPKAYEQYVIEKFILSLESVEVKFKKSNAKKVIQKILSEQ